MSRIREELEALTAPGGPFAIVVEEVHGVPGRTFAGCPHHLSEIAEPVAAHAATHLAPFKVPEVWDLRGEALPRNPAGKVVKAVLRGTASAVMWADGDSAL